MQDMSEKCTVVGKDPQQPLPTDQVRRRLVTSQTPLSARRTVRLVTVCVCVSLRPQIDSPGWFRFHFRKAWPHSETRFMPVGRAVRAESSTSLSAVFHRTSAGYLNTINPHLWLESWSRRTLFKLMPQTKGNI